MARTKVFAWNTPGGLSAASHRGFGRELSRLAVQIKKWHQ
jgi:hypothetical protein